MDKISYTSGMTIGLPEYSSVRFDVTYESDVKKGESPEDAYTRIKEFVEAKIEGELDEVEKLRPKRK